MTKQDMSPAGAAVDIHATGQPDTPVEVLTHLLQTALKQTSLEDTRSIVQQALDIVGGKPTCSHMCIVVCACAYADAALVSIFCNFQQAVYWQQV
jgi:hypothetical protein